MKKIKELGSRKEDNSVYCLRYKGNNMIRLPANPQGSPVLDLN